MRKMVILLVVIPFVAGCSSMLMPYNEEPLCNKGVQSGWCGSVSEIYEDMEENPKKYGIGGVR